ncbi:MAG: 6-phosphogluconolactonase [Anaerolineae bacterium]|nr:6-phosphogluconolactonase [Anaerolineae bacterium]MDQ7035584.1 6-phosphogluconolactonase [Anaerolineae bacterium]
MENWDNVKIQPDKQTLIRYAAERILRIASATLEVNDTFSIALSGGSTPYPVYEHIATKFADILDWQRVHIWWGDERSVPIDHAENNYHNTKKVLFDPLNIPETNIHRIHGEDDPHEAAKAYEQEIREFFAEDEQLFDLNLLGMGEDGHTASLFPKTDALNEDEKLFVAHHVTAKGDMWRITQTFPTIYKSSNIMFLISGTGKADAFYEVMQGADNPTVYPAQTVARSQHPHIVWVVDEAAAAKLK